MSEWLKEHAWKACKVARPSQVRILFSPPEQNATHGVVFFGTGAATGLTGGICDVIIFYDGILGRAKACSFIFGEVKNCENGHREAIDDLQEAGEQRNGFSIF